MRIRNMGKRYLAFAVVLLLPYGARAEEKFIRKPCTLPPQVCLATATEKDGAIQIHVSIPRMIPYEVTTKVPVTRMVHRDGKSVPETEFVQRTRTDYLARMEETTLVADGDVKVSRKDGASVDPKKLPKLLAETTHVLVTTVVYFDPYYLEVVGKRVLVITIPASKLPSRKAKE
jgi:hypothetical protein